ncbi:hypothetical protein AMS68_005747 [Peltaster fructicola]|uniref:Nucleoporin Nup159/Nup146 N-terminal domain-containing protein n=1 Tax=Peltaster fructicola TaxID=286661 RepID=A0A6H0Y0P9_9PEZI|nr:hypothetical protein AMS68_005747 [Peltaster fructicola]
MSWGFGGLPSATPGGAAQANAAPDLEAIETEQLGFQALAGDRKVKLLSQPWPVEALPSKTASLLSVASGRGLLAAAGPDSLFLYETDSIRSAFSRDGSDNVEDLSAKQRSSIPRISHLAFTSDEQALVITAEEGGGLAVYDVGAGLSGSQWTPGMQIPTSGVSVRHLLPNPNKDAAHLLALVLTDGKLVIANLKEQKLATGSSGSSVLRENVSCASWSKMGKQIVAGLADGTAVQLDVQGNQKEQIPRPPNTDAGSPVTAIFWLENMDFLLIHAPVSAQADADSMMPLDALYHLVHRDKDSKVCSFHKFAVDPCPPFLDERLPAHHYMQRIRDWQPNLDDTLIVACTASTDVGTLTRSKVPLSQDLPAEKITHTYTTTSLMDTRRAALPMGADAISDTFPIGVALDLSSKQKVTKPIPTDETIDESSTPLPQLCILNQEGNLCAWWYVYNEAVRGNQPAPGLAAIGAAQSSTPQATQPASSAFGSGASGFGAATQPASQATPPKPAFGQASTPAFGQTSTPSFGQTSTPSFGQTSTPSFGQASTPSFGHPSAPGFGKPAFGQTASPWGQSAGGSFGKPSFGATSQVGLPSSSAFGQAGGLGNKASPWGSGASKTGGSTFGQPSAFGGNAGAQSPFANVKENGNKTASPFAGFAQNKVATSPFAAFNTQNKDKLSPFAAAGKPSMPNESSFGSTVTLSSNNTSSFGSGATFGTAAPFGKTSETKEEAMDDSETPREEKKESTTLAGASGFKLGTTFRPDDSAKNNETESKDVSSSLFGFGFGKALGDVAKEKPTDIPVIKEEPNETEGLSLKDIPEAPATKQNVPLKQPEAAPLPPDFLSKKGVDTKEEKGAQDAPLPPDFLSSKSKTADEAPLPPDFLSAKPKTDVDAPLPPDTLQSKSEQIADESDIPLPSKEIAAADASLPDDEFEDLSGVEDDYDDDGEEEGEELGEDGQEDDDEPEWEDEDANEDEEDYEDEDDDQSPVIENQKKLSAFEARVTPASPKKTGNQHQSTTPETVQKPTFTPAGFPKLNYIPTRKLEDSPRSPSPVRAVTSPVRFDQSRSAAPSVKQANVPTLQHTAMKSSLFKDPRRPAPEEDLEDDDDRQIKRILAAPIDPNKTLPDFIAHQDYAGASRKEGIAGQLERVYRDVNSMIDTLGLNARALQAFVAGHEATRSEAVNEDDLEDADSWTIGEISALEKLQIKVEDRLENGRVTEVSEKIADIQEQDEQMGRMKSKATELRKQISSRTDPDKKAQQQNAPLPQAWAAQQIELRSNLRNVQKLLTQVEDNISLLRADLASASASTGEVSGTGVPTVEAVTKTILKMTAMIEQKSGDVDMLEAQIRRLPGGKSSLGLSAGYEDDLVDSLAGSRLSNGHSTYSTPPRKGRGAVSSALGMSGMLGSRLRTPPSASFRSSIVFEPGTSSFGRSMASVGSARKKMVDVTADEVEEWKNKAGRRRKVLAALRQAVDNAGDTRTVKPEV